MLGNCRREWKWKLNSLHSIHIHTHTHNEPGIFTGKWLKVMILKAWSHSTLAWVVDGFSVSMKLKLAPRLTLQCSTIYVMTEKRSDFDDFWSSACSRSAVHHVQVVYVLRCSNVLTHKEQADVPPCKFTARTSFHYGSGMVVRFNCFRCKIDWYCIGYCVTRSCLTQLYNTVL